MMLWSMAIHSGTIEDMNKCSFGLCYFLSENDCLKLQLRQNPTTWEPGLLHQSYLYCWSFEVFAMQCTKQTLQRGCCWYICYSDTKRITFFLGLLFWEKYCVQSFYMHICYLYLERVALLGSKTVLIPSSVVEEAVASFLLCGK